MRANLQILIAVAVLALSLAWFLRFRVSADGNNAPATDIRPVGFVPPPIEYSDPNSEDNTAANKVVKAEPPRESTGLTPERREEILKAVQRLDLSRAQHIGTWELGGVSQMMVLLKTPNKAELDQLAADISSSLAVGSDDPDVKLLKAEAHEQLRAFMDSPFPLQLITFCAPFAEGDPMTFDIAYLAREEHLTLDPNGGPPTFIIAGGVAGKMTDETIARYGHLFQLE